ncbi:MAG: polyprenyl diphosphate synthase [Candidatus Berkiellales bacterium]
MKANPQNLPQHIAIIMDGNGRWAAGKSLTRTAGHRRGVEVVHDVVVACQQKGIKVLTLFAFGVENWKRPAKEVRNLFRLLFLVLNKDILRLHENNIKLRIIGNREVFYPSLLKAIQDAEALTQNNTGLILNVAVNYSGRWDLIQAMQKLCHQVNAEISEESLSHELSLYGLPEPDLLIRTGGVQRISNFMLWELAYAELYFTHALWPDFTTLELDKALEDYASRERRFGLTSEQLG